MNDLPGYELKDYGAAKGIMSAAENVYKNGTVLKQGDVMYNKYKNDLKIGIDKGGRNTLMSLIYDDLIGDTRLADDPYIAQNVEAYRNGNMTFEALRDVVVDNYMGVLVDHSKQGFSARQPRGGSAGNSYNPLQQKFKNLAEDLKRSGFTDEQIAEHIANLQEQNKIKIRLGSTNDQQSQNTTGGYIGGLQIK
jgi:hypothetical protein